MQQHDLDCPQFSVGEVMPTARTILKASRRLAVELAAMDPPCNTQEYLTYFASAAAVLTALTTHNLMMEEKSA